ncbi:MAG: ribonuclease H family protein [Psychromonas sp.]|nr:ribonuclease H family protein [Psychromonas sp.]
MAKKYYVVWQGRETGIFDDWESCKIQIDRFAGAKYKSFKTLAEAQAAFRRGSDITLMEKAPSPKKSLSTVKSYSAVEIAAIPIETKIFSDGGCEPNPGEAGSGVAVYRDNVIAELWYGLYNANGTNNSAELNALKEALKIALAEIKNGKRAVIFCDSKYAIQCITDWAIKWEQKGWTKPSGEIKNLALIKEIFQLYRPMRNKLEILHVNGHIGVEGNELADRMSIIAIDFKEANFIRYQQALDVQAILSLRGG